MIVDLIRLEFFENFGSAYLCPDEVDEFGAGSAPVVLRAQFIRVKPTSTLDD